ncbi:hypothetical protein R7W54_03090 [Mesomycoplasma ovipneumoniae]|uniref:Restriction endonuclease subunit S n=2 Tax=Mesomycoplasma ovipneumoniae TaxID=29562 RepID=A0AAJ2UCW1_9BACT|nr:hypothetical protein [Mesomycoplasma ovipneumoniae]MDW2892944.1 hypothetical protein [Mesomycoplasma ovipneumoniae]
MKKLMNYAIYSNEKLSIDGLDVFYVGVENILPNKKGIKPSSFVPKTGKYTKFEKYDILLGNIGPYLKKIWLADKSGLASPDVLVIKPLESRFGKYIYANLLNDSFFQYAMLGVKGSILPRCDKNHILNYSIPDVKNKEKIGDFIYFINKKIELNNKINDNLEKQAKLLYDYWFTQFDFPDENGNPYKSSGGEMVFSEELKRYIPKGWSIETLLNNTISRIIKPGVNKFKEKTYFATADINNKEISSGNKVLYQNRESRANMQPIKSSVWFAKMKNSVKHLFITDNMDFMINEGILSTGFCGLECEKISFEYISSFINSPYFEMAKDILSHGATQEAVNNNDLNFINILIPDRRTLLNFHKITKAIYEQITENICSNRKLTELRDYLLPLLLNGQVTIED